MKGSEFLRKIKDLGHRNRVDVRIEHQRGKGSHGTLFYGNRFTIIRNLKDELKTGTYRAMLKQLGIHEKELRKIL
jgi:mRNA interferase HicA